MNEYRAKTHRGEVSEKSHYGDQRRENECGLQEPSKVSCLFIPELSAGFPASRALLSASRSREQRKDDNNIGMSIPFFVSTHRPGWSGLSLEAIRIWVQEPAHREGVASGGSGTVGLGRERRHPQCGASETAETLASAAGELP